MLRRWFAIVTAMVAWSAWAGSGCDGGTTATPENLVAASHAAVGVSVTAQSATAVSAGSGGAPATFSCNPVTNKGCAAGEACDTDHGELAFVCYAGDSKNALCAPCGNAVGYCKVGATCVQGKCLKFCCTDADCSAKGFCDKTVLAKFGKGEVGVCRVQPMGMGGAGGMMKPPPAVPDCDAMAASPSMGTCVP